MDALGINAGFFIAQLLNFGIFFLLISLFAWRPLLNMLDERAEKVAKGLEDARVASEARANAEVEAQKVLTEARAEAQRIIAEARAKADDSAKPILHAAEAEAAKIKADAQARAKELQDNALNGVRGQVVSLAMAAANRLIGEGMDSKQQERIVNEFFSTSTSDIAGLGGDAVVVTALPLSDSEKKSIEGKLGGGVSGWQVDPSILGGIIVRSGDKVVDGSVRSKLGGLSSSLN